MLILQYGHLNAIYGSYENYDGTPMADQGHGAGDGSSHNGHRGDGDPTIGDTSSGGGGGRDSC